MVLFFIAGQGIIIAADYWLSIWSTEEEKFDMLHKKCASNATVQECENFYNFYQSDVYNVSSQLKYADRTQKFNVYLS